MPSAGRSMRLPAAPAAALDSHRAEPSPGAGVCSTPPSRPITRGSTSALPCSVKTGSGVTLGCVSCSSLLS